MTHSTQEMHSECIQEISSDNRGSGEKINKIKLYPLRSDSCPYAVPAPLADREREGGGEDSSVEKWKLKRWLNCK